MFLHVPTLLIVASALLSFQGILLLASRRSHPQQRTLVPKQGVPKQGVPKQRVPEPGVPERRAPEPLVLWGAGMLAGAIGMALAALPGAPVWLADGIARALMLLGAGLGWGASALFTRRRPNVALIAAGPLLWLAAVVATHSVTAEQVRAALSCLMGAGYAWATAAELWAGRAERLPSRRIVITLQLLHGSVFVARALLPALIWPVPPELREQVIVFMLLEVLLHTSGVTFGLMAMAKERAELARLAAVTQARDAAQAAAQARLRFIARLSHEIRSALHAVLGLADMLAEDGALAPEQHDQADAMREAGWHLLALVNDALDLARIDAGRLALERRAFRPAAVAGACTLMLQSEAAAKAVRLETVVQPGVPSAVTGDPTRLRQILLNLLGNAVKFSPPGGVVRLTMRTARPAELTFEVTDSGPGISPSNLADLLDGRDRIAGQTAGGGAGIGLSIVGALVRAMAGTIACTPGEGAVGSCFRVALPLPPADLTESVVPAGPAVAARRLRVLVIDDVRANQQLAAAVLRRAGHHAEVVADGAAAVAAVAAGDADLVVTDVQMPGMDGQELTRRLRALPAPQGLTPVIGMTAETGAAALAAYRAAGMAEVLVKPMDTAALIGAVERAAAGLPQRQPPAPQAEGASESNSAASSPAATDAAALSISR